VYWRPVFNHLGRVLLILSAILAALWVWSWLDEVLGDPAESSAHLAILLSSLISGALGTLMHVPAKRGDVSSRSTTPGRREALLLVALIWIVGAGISALPYLFWAHTAVDIDPAQPFHSFVNCYFEAMSGLSTTGATVLSDVEGVPRSLLVWRSMTQWLGGLGIVVLFVAVLPGVGIGAKRLFRAEAPGPDPEGVRPHIQETARILWMIYTGMTIAAVFALHVSGMTWFDAVNHALTTLATGGFSTHTDSIEAFNSPAIEIVTLLFMVLAGINFSIYDAVARRRFKGITRDPELRAYLIMLVSASIIVVASLLIAGVPYALTDGEVIQPTLGQAMLDGTFTVVSQQTTTGFVIADFNTWPFLAKGVIIAVMFIGGSAGSTAGGVKVIRFWICLRVIFNQVERVYRPNVVRPMRLGSAVITQERQLDAVAFVLGMLVILGVGAVTLELLEGGSEMCDFTTAATASLATLCTVGPGLERVGAIENFGWFSDASKIVMCLLMTIGRLEFFAIAVLISPRFWRNG
jgi:trk system potassium uptake protein TrkH